MKMATATATAAAAATATASPTMDMDTPTPASANDSDNDPIPSPSSNPSPNPRSIHACVVTVTYYPDIADARFVLALRLCELAARRKIPLVVVDGSPDHVTVRGRLLAASSSDGHDGCVRVFEQERPKYSGKGGSLRQAIREAKRMLGGGSDGERGEAAIVFTEPEKVDLLNHVVDVVRPILEGSAEVVVPARDDGLFRATYPIEQYHSESFGNMHFDLLARRSPGGFFGERGRTARAKLDWLFGPFAFRMDLADSWLEYGGNSWDAQMVPYVRGVRTRGWRITSVIIGYRHPVEMKEQEEGDPTWTTKRLSQLNLLFELLGKGELASDGSGIDRDD